MRGTGDELEFGNRNVQLPRRSLRGESGKENGVTSYPCLQQDLWNMTYNIATKRGCIKKKLHVFPPFPTNPHTSEVNRFNGSQINEKMLTIPSIVRGRPTATFPKDTPLRFRL
ncbi:GQ67_04669T0 [Komagataella phaffii]|nr:GQ67_04669T0 [Komagataella phaffii]AOA69872.1 GQ68_04641T0 [Komagataella phaffii GS115]CAH2451053.1 Predicted protein [Komagataella phaffii CBS 7435]